MNSAIVINEERCIGCGLCVQDCPGNAIVLRDHKAAAERPCITCGSLSLRGGFHTGL